VFRNFWSMPRGLRFLTACSTAAPLCALGSMLPGGHVIVNGQRVANGLLWRSGVGVALAAVALLIAVADVGMLRRARGSRGLFVGGSLLSIVVVVWIPHLLLAIPRPGFEAVAPAMLMVLGMAAYLYASAGVRSYFRGDDLRKSGSLPSSIRRRPSQPRIAGRGAEPLVGARSHPLEAVWFNG